MKAANYVIAGSCRVTNTYTTNTNTFSYRNVTTNSFIARNTDKYSQSGDAQSATWILIGF